MITQQVLGDVARFAEALKPATSELVEFVVGDSSVG
jgi:hypothetical protein